MDRDWRRVEHRVEFHRVERIKEHIQTSETTKGIMKWFKWPWWYIRVGSVNECLSPQLLQNCVPSVVISGRCIHVFSHCDTDFLPQGLHRIEVCAFVLLQFDWHLGDTATGNIRTLVFCPNFMSPFTTLQERVRHSNLHHSILSTSCTRPSIEQSLSTRLRWVNHASPQVFDSFMIYLIHWNFMASERTNKLSSRTNRSRGAYEFSRMRINRYFIHSP